MTFRSRDLQSDSDLDSIRNTCDVWTKKHLFFTHPKKFTQADQKGEGSTLTVSLTIKRLFFYDFPFQHHFFLWRYYIRRHIFLRGFEEIILRLCQHLQKLVTKSYKDHGNFGSNCPCPKNRCF